LFPVLKVLGLNPNGITHQKYRETPINKGFLDISYKEIRVPFLVLISKFEPRNRRKLFFQEITVTFLKDFEAFLDDRPRAQSLYIGQMHHIFREAMLEYNTDDEIVIKNDPFLRYKAPKQVLKKGVRALSLDQLMKVVNYQPKKNTLAELAHDCFILSFCLMSMNSVDMYQVSCLENGTIKYKRTKTKDHRSDEVYIEVKVHPYIQPLMEKWKGGHITFNDSAIRRILPRHQSHVRFLRISTVIDDFSCRLMLHGIVHHILYCLIERSCYLTILVIVAAALGIDVRYLLIITTL